MDAVTIIKKIRDNTDHEEVRKLAEKWLEENGIPEHSQFKHCDDYIHDHNAPECLRFFLLVHRLPAVETALLHANGVRPKLFATLKGKRVRIVMVSRLGDVGITTDLDKDVGYEDRVPLDKLDNFNSEP